MFSCLMTVFFTSLMRMKPSVFWCSGYLFLIRFVGNGLLFDFVSGRRRLFFYIYIYISELQIFFRKEFCFNIFLFV